MPSHKPTEVEPVKTFRFRDLRNHPRKPDTSIISEGILKEGSLLVIGGPPKSYKSFILNTIAIALSCGRPMFNAFRSNHGRPQQLFKIDKPRKVMIVEQEVGEDDLEDRLVPFYNSLPPDQQALVDENLFTHSFDPSLRFDTAEGMKSIESMLLGHKPEVVIFDPLIEFHNQEENSNTAMSTILKNFVTLCRKCKVTPILSHHEGKAGERAGAERLRGASALYGKGDCFLSLGAVNRNAGRIRIDFTLRRRKPIKSMIVKLDFDTLETRFLCWQGSKDWAKYSNSLSEEKSALEELETEGKVQ